MKKLEKQLETKSLFLCLGHKHIIGTICAETADVLMWTAKGRAP